MALKGVYRLGDVLRRGEIAHPPARHGVRLGNAVDGDGEFLHFLRASRDGERLYAVITELFVNFVGKHEDLFFLADFGYRAHFFFRIYRARGIGRGIEDQHFRLRRDRRGKPGGRKLEFVLFPAFEIHGYAAADFDDLRIGEPIGSGDNHLVPLFDERETGVENGVFGAVGNNDLRRLVIKTVILLKFFADRLPQRQKSRGGGVFRIALVESGLRRVDDIFRGVEVGFAHAEGNDRLPRRFHGFRLRRDGKRQRRRNGGHSRCDSSVHM